MNKIIPLILVAFLAGSAGAEVLYMEDSPGVYVIWDVRRSSPTFVQGLKDSGFKPIPGGTTEYFVAIATNTSLTKAKVIERYNLLFPQYIRMGLDHVIALFDWNNAQIRVDECHQNLNHVQYSTATVTDLKPQIDAIEKQVKDIWNRYVSTGTAQ